MIDSIKHAPMFDFFPERFWFAVEGWTEQEICRYWRLLSQQWMRNGLPESERDLAGLARGKVSPRLLEKFPVATDGLRRNPFLETVRLEQRKRIAARKLGAAMANLKRYGEGSLSEDDRSILLAAGKLAQRQDSESLNGRSATVERFADESPPLTTDHCPLSPSSAIAEGVQGERASSPPADDGKVIPTPRTSRKAQPITDGWLDELKPRYPHVDVRAQLTRAQTWIEAHPGRSLSRPFFVNWLNRIEPPPQHGKQPQNPTAF